MGRAPQSANAEEMEQRKKLEQRARRFAGPPPAKESSTPDGRLVKLATKRPSDQGLDGNGQAPTKQMRLIASRKVVAKARATVVQQRQNLIQQQQPRTVVPPQPTRQLSASSQQPATAQRVPASQRLGTRSSQPPQSGVGNQKTTADTSAARPTRPISDVSYAHS